MLITKATFKKILISKDKYIRIVAKKGLTGTYFFEDRFKKQFNLFSNEKKEKNENIQEVEQQTKVKKSKLTWVFLLINIVVVAGILIFQFANDGVKPLHELFAEHPYYRFIFLSLGLFVVLNIFEVLKFLFLIYNSTKKWRPYVAFKLAIYGKYWDYITPFATGGQAFQIIELKKNNFSGDVATGIPLSKYLFWQIAFIMLSVIVFVTPLNAISSTEAQVVKYAAIIGFAANSILFILNILVGINKKVGEKIIVGSVKIGAKLKIVKNPTSTIKRAAVFVDNYQKCMKNFVSSFRIFIVQILLAFGGILAQYTIAYSVYLAFNFPSYLIYDWFEIISLALLCEQAVSFVPLPGGAAAAEVSFMAIFSALFAVRGGGVVFWAMLIWRFCTYYLFIIQGIIVMFIDALIIKRKEKRVKKI